MDSQSTLWLYPLALMAAIALVLYVRIGIRWTWGFCLQALSMLVAAAIGFVFKPAAAVAASVGWAIFVVAILLPRAILSRLEHNLNMLVPEAAMSDARRLRWFFWGAPGRFWSDITQAMAAFIKGDRDTAESLVKQWERFPMPKGARDGLLSYSLSGRILLRDWSGIVDEFTRLRQSPAKRIPYGAAIAASRAYLELGKIPEALACIEGSDLSSSRIRGSALSTIFLPFFALSGAPMQLEALLDDLGRGRQALAECARLYWIGRCYGALGKVQEATQLFQKASLSAPANLSAWKDRIQYQLNKLDETARTVPAPDWSNEIERASRLLERARMVSDIVSPQRTRPAVIALSGVILAAYAVSHSYSIAATQETLRVSLSCFQLGVLDARAVASGEYWRLVTYLFLHSHVSHLALNLVGLWWFGRLAENLFGTGRFLLIYFASGILSALAHVILSPEMLAVGASGAVMGVFGAASAGTLRLKDILPESIRRTEVSWMLGLAAAQVVLDQIVPHVAVFAHLGGLVAGLVLGLIVPLRKLN